MARSPALVRAWEKALLPRRIRQSYSWAIGGGQVVQDDNASSVCLTISEQVVYSPQEEAVVITNDRPAVHALNPPLKWAGGKRWLVPRLREIWQDHGHRRLVEPLSGGLAVALGLLPKRALLSDINPHNMNFYAWLKAGLTLDIEMCNDSESYYRHRVRFNELIALGQEKTCEAAQLFFYLNRTGYNGLVRFNRRGEFNVPFGRHSAIHYERDFSPYQKAFEDWDFRCGDFEDLAIEPEDFIYADPPYDVEFTKYSKEDFDWQDQERLIKWLEKHPGPVVLSNQRTDRVVDLYKSHGFHIEVLDAPRRISCNGDRTKAKEVLATRGL
jgi:DNA adenine methylase